jgi:hypothetical protein
MHTFFFIYRSKYIAKGSRDSSVGIATGYRLDGPGSIPSSNNFSVLSVQSRTGAHPASYPVATAGSFFGCKAAGP